MHARDIRNRTRRQSRKLTEEPRRRGTKELASYMTIRELGQGGSGVVYEAFHNRTKRKVALKCLEPRLSSAAHSALEEAAIGSRLKDPRCVEVIDAFFDEASSSPVIVSELVEGRDLELIVRSDWYRRGIDTGALDLVDRLVLCEQVLLALAAAHKVGIVHRDVKPGNFLVTREALELLKRRASGQLPGRSPFLDRRDAALLKLSDWGLSLIRDQDLPVSETLSFQLSRLPDARRGGTLALLALEQIDGVSLSRRTDLFALGLVFYEVLTAGRAEDARRHAEGLSDRALREPTRFLVEIARSDAESAVAEHDPELRSRGIPAPIQRYLVHLTQREKTGRPTTLDALNALRAFLADPPPLGRTRRRGRTGARLFLALLIFVLTAAALIALSPDLRAALEGWLGNPWG